MLFKRRTFRNRFPSHNGRIDRRAAAQTFYSHPLQYLPASTVEGAPINKGNVPSSQYLLTLPTDPPTAAFTSPKSAALPFSAVIDTGSPQAVCGKAWLTQFHLLSDSEAAAAPLEPCSPIIRFGANEKHEAVLGRTTLTFRVRTTQGKVLMLPLSVVVIDAPIPLLISKTDLRSWCTIIDCDQAKFTFSIDGESATVQAVDSGNHFLLPLHLGVPSDYYFLGTYLYSSAELTKLHAQFGHRPLAEMLRLLTAGSPQLPAGTIQAYTAVHQNCVLCAKYSKPPPPPIVSIPHATFPGQILHVDIMQADGDHILLVVDSFSNLRITLFLGPKPTTAVALESLSQILVSPLGTGVPDRILLDQEGAFAAKEVERYLQQLGVQQILYAPRGAHFYNGLVETAITMLRRQIRIVRDERRLSIAQALPLATIQLNSIVGRNGLSPSLLWHGRQLRWPHDSQSLASAVPTDADVARHPAWAYLRELQLVRDRHYATKAQDRIALALRHQLREPTLLAQLSRGQQVYVYRAAPGQKLGTYEGPFTFIGDDGGRRAIILTSNKVMLVHASHILATDRVSAFDFPSSAAPLESLPLQAPLSTDPIEFPSTVPALPPISISPPLQTSSVVPAIRPLPLESLETMAGQVFGAAHSPLPTPPASPDSRRVGTMLPPETSLVVPILPTSCHAVTPISSGAPDVFPADVGNPAPTHTPGPAATPERLSSPPEEALNPALPLTASAAEPLLSPPSSSEEPANPALLHAVSAAVSRRNVPNHSLPTNEPAAQNSQIRLNRRGKPVPDYRKLAGVKSRSFMVSAQPAHRTDKVAYQTAIDDPGFQSAMLLELESFKQHGCVQPVPLASLDPSTPVLSTRWVLTKQWHLDATAPRYKARLTVRGYEDPEKYDVMTYAPTIMRCSIRLILFVLAQHLWVPWTVDFQTAFLQGSEVTRPLFIQPPPDFAPPTTIWRVLKGIYGLPSAPAAWYAKLHEALLECGFIRSRFDPALYFLWSEGSLQGVLGTHVDDSLYGGTQSMHATITRLTSKLKAKEPKHPPMDFLGLKISVVTTTIRTMEILLNQSSYAQSIEPMPLTEPVSPTDYRTSVGQLLYLTGHTRPDLAYAVSVAASANKNPQLRDVQLLNQLVVNAKKVPSQLRFNAVADPRCVTFSDAAWANLKDKGSQGGFISMIMSSNFSLIGGVLDFRSHRLQRVVQSSTAAETLAITEAVDSGVWVRELMAEAGFPKHRIRAYTDCNDLFQNCRNKTVPKERRLMINLASIRDDIEATHLEVVWLPKQFNLADPLTKLRTSHYHLRYMLDSNKVLFKQYQAQLKLANSETLNYFYGVWTAQTLGYYFSCFPAYLDESDKEGNKRKNGIDMKLSASSQPREGPQQLPQNMEQSIFCD